MKDLLIRLATPSDAVAIQRIYAPYVRETAITFCCDVPSVSQMQADMGQIQEKYPYLVAEREGAVIGYAYASALSPRAAYQWSVETSIYVRQDQKRTHVGRALYAALEARLCRQGIVNLYACIASPETSDVRVPTDSVLFHKKMGYTKVGEFHRCGCKFGRWYHVIWMEKSIGPHPDHPADVRWCSQNTPDRSVTSQD